MINMKKIIIFTLLTFMLSCYPKPHEEDYETVNLVMFIDAYGGENSFGDHAELIFEDYIQPIIISYLEKNLDFPAFLLKASIYPLDGTTELANPLLVFKVDRKDAFKIMDSKYFLRDMLEEKKRELKIRLENYENPEDKIRITSSIPIVYNNIQALKLDGKKERTHVIYFSDLIELDFPSVPSKGRYSFLEKGTNIVDVHSLSMAVNQLNDKNSFLNKNVLTHLPEIYFSDTKLRVFRPGNIKPTPHPDGGGYEKVERFWTSLFKRSGFSDISISSIQNCESYEL